MSESKPKRRLVTFADIAAAQDSSAVPVAPVQEKPEEATKRVTYADLAALSKRPQDFTATPVQGIPATPATVQGTPVPEKDGAPAPGIPVMMRPLAGIALGGRQIRQAMSAEDGHSFGEQAVYAALWAAAQSGTPAYRILTIGYRALSHACRLTVNNCKANLHNLIRKLAIEEAGKHSYTQAKTYRVYSPEAIMERRAAAGLVYYVRSRGVTFVNPKTGVEIGIPGQGVLPPERA